jgi:hypothetical protein
MWSFRTLLRWNSCKAVIPPSLGKTWAKNSLVEWILVGVLSGNRQITRLLRGNEYGNRTRDRVLFSVLLGSLCAF